VHGPSVHFDKFIFIQLLKKYSECYTIRTLIALFTWTHDWVAFWARWIQSPTSQSIPLSLQFNIILQSTLRWTNLYLTFRYSSSNFVSISHVSHMCRTPRNFVVLSNVLYGAVLLSLTVRCSYFSTEFPKQENRPLSAVANSLRLLFIGTSGVSLSYTITVFWFLCPKSTYRKTQILNRILFYCESYSFPDNEAKVFTS
jgi:hypothetical protein